MPEIPDRIGRYEVLNLLGQGGMGVLYLARDPVIDRHVALKLLKVDNEDLRRRFVREARSAGRLQHPNIVTVYDVGDHDGELFIAMEYIDGDTLATLIRDDAPFSTLRKLEMIDQLADGLGFAHECGIIHRDIKPANLMVTRGGLLKVLDFGIARINRADAVASLAGTVLGTPAYMSPEQLQGGDVDHRADIFAVGLVMYELLSGRRAFAGPTTADVLERVLATEPTPLEDLVPAIDPGLVQCVKRAIAKRPDDRYGDLEGLRHDLARVRRRVELESGAFDATVVVQLPTTSRLTGSTPAQAPVPAMPEPRPANAAAAAPAADDETIIAPLFASEVSPPPLPPPPAVAAPAPVASAPVAVAGGTSASQVDGTAALPARRSVLPALIVLGVVVLMLAAGTIAALWWVRYRLFDSSPAPAIRTEATQAESSAASVVQGTTATPAVSTDAPIAATEQPSSGGPSSEAPTPAPAPVNEGMLDVTARPSSSPAVSDVRKEEPAPQEPAPPRRNAPPPSADPSQEAPSRVAGQETVGVSKAVPQPAEELVVPRDEAVALVRAYVAARNTGHAAGLRRVWPTASDNDIRRMTSEFSAPLTLSGCDVVRTDGGRMRATCQLTQPGSTGFSEGTALTIRRQLVFAMERQGRGLVITDVTG